MMAVLILQDKWPWTGITLPLVDNFLEGRGGMPTGDEALTSLDTTQRTVS